MNSKGQSLTELLIAMGIGVAVSLTLATTFAFGITQFKLLVEQNKAEISAIQASFLMKSYLSQAVKINCVNGNGVGTGPLPGAQLDATDNSPPMLVGRGYIDCVPGATASNRMVAIPQTPGMKSTLLSSAVHVWTPNVKNIFAAFIRESGGASPINPLGQATAGSGIGASNYVPAGIFFSPPTGIQSGILYFSQGSGTTVSSASSTQWDHIVDVGVISGTAVEQAIPNNGGTNPYNGKINLVSLQVRITTRYFTAFDQNFANSYEPFPNGNAPASCAPNCNFNHWDIETVVPINFRNSFLGKSGSGNGTPERVFGGIYFFRFLAPPLTAFDI